MLDTLDCLLGVRFRKLKSIKHDLGTQGSGAWLEQTMGIYFHAAILKKTSVYSSQHILPLCPSLDLQDAMLAESAD